VVLDKMLLDNMVLTRWYGQSGADKNGMDNMVLIKWHRFKFNRIFIW